MANKKNNLLDKEYTYYHWGPLLFKTKIEPSDLRKLRKLCDEATEDWSENLAGLIKTENLINSSKFIEIIKPYIDVYHHAYHNWYGLKITSLDCVAAWVNYMKKGESNPPHIHHNCHLSSVLVIDVPPKLKEEQKAWKGTGDGPGALHFLTGNPQNFHTNSFGFRPEIGDFFIFPWNVTHSVSSYKSNVTRITIAANFSITTPKNDKK